MPSISIYNRVYEIYILLIAAPYDRSSWQMLEAAGVGEDVVFHRAMCFGLSTSPLLTHSAG